jgi:hypothetical protein
MFVGHAGVALLAAGRRAAPPLPVLLLAAYGPDWLELPWRLAGWEPARVALVTHSLVATLLAGALAGAAWWIARRERTPAVLVALAWWSHWGADFVTAVKPTWPGGPAVGLGLYGHAVADLLVEGVVLLAGWWAFARRERPRRTVAVLAPAALLVLQLAFVNQHRLPFGDWKSRVLSGIAGHVRS